MCRWVGGTGYTLHLLRYLWTEQWSPLLFQPTRMTALSEALDDLLRDVNALKKRLEGLNERFDLINKAFVRKRLRMAPRTPVASAGRLSSFLQSRQVKITQPPLRPYPVKRRVYIRRRKVKN
ncbi:hypothetical protein FKM82_023473 [Ascaphus truei]